MYTREIQKPDVDEQIMVDDTRHILDESSQSFAQLSLSPIRTREIVRSLYHIHRRLHRRDPNSTFVKDSGKKFHRQRDSQPPKNA